MAQLPREIINFDDEMIPTNFNAISNNYGWQSALKKQDSTGSFSFLCKNYQTLRDDTEKISCKIR